MTLSSNNFAKDTPSKGGSFAEDKPTQGGSFAKDNPSKSNVIFDGDNTASSPFGGDFATFGDIYGQGNFGGISHFKNRTTPPQINH